MENSVEEVKKKLDIVEFIGSFITLKKAGRNFKAICPFHQEKSPSFIVSPDRQIWHCFGACGEGGDVIKFLMKWENITFYEALKELAQKTGVKLDRSGYPDEVWKKKERYLNMNAKAAEFFRFILDKTRFGKKGKDYLETRKIKPETAEKFQIGYSPDSWDSLKLYLKKKKFSEFEMTDNGLLVKTERGTFYDRFRGRLMFPIRDSRGNILAFSGRSFGDAKQAKYINSPETPVYHKRETLFGIDLAKEMIKKDNNVFLVEGEFDMITPYQNGFKNFVAIKGTALTMEQLMYLKRFTDRLTLVFDADQAGEESVKRGIEEAERLDFEIMVVRFDYAKDPDEALNIDPVKFKKVIGKPVPIYDFLIDAATKKYNDGSPFSKKKIADEVMPFVNRIVNPIVKSHYIKKVAKLLDVTETSVENLLYQINRRKKQSELSKPVKPELTAETRSAVIEKYILSYVFQSDQAVTVGKRIFANLDAADFHSEAHRKLYRKFMEAVEKNSFNVNNFAHGLATELRAAFDEIFLFASNDTGLSDQSTDKLAGEIKRFALKRRIKDLLAGDKDDAETKKQLALLSDELKQVEKRLVSL